MQRGQRSNEYSDKTQNYKRIENTPQMYCVIVLKFRKKFTKVEKCKMFQDEYLSKVKIEKTPVLGYLIRYKEVC